MVVPAVVLLVSVPLAIPFMHDIRTHAGGDAAAWGRMGELIILMGLIPAILIASGALLAAVVALGMYGWADPATVRRTRREPWYEWLVRPRPRAEVTTRLYVSLGSLIVVGILWLAGVRPG